MFIDETKFGRSFSCMMFLPFQTIFSSIFTCCFSNIYVVLVEYFCIEFFGLMNFKHLDVNLTYIYKLSLNATQFFLAQKKKRSNVK
jgi:hypothetical protein